MSARAPAIWTSRQKIEPRGFLNSLMPVAPRTEGTNRWYLFRRELTLDAVPAQAPTKITVDGRYQLFVNGTRLARGPVRSAATAQKYDTVDLAPALRPGVNAIAVLVHVFGVDTSWYEKTVGVVDACFGDGALWVDGDLVRSDLGWRCLHSDAWRQDVPQADHGLDFIECLDARRLPEGWQQPGFDDHGWDAVQVLEAGGGGPQAFFGGLTIRPFPVLQPNPLPPLVERFVPVGAPFSVRGLRCDAALPIERRAYEEELLPLPEGAVQSADGGWQIRTADGQGVVLLFRLERSITGHIAFEVDAHGGEEIEVCVSEQVPGEWAPGGPTADARVVRFPQLGLDAQLTRYTARPGAQSFERFSWQALRWLQVSVRNAPQGVRLHGVGVRQTHYPVGDAGRFECSDPVLTRLWQTGAYTLQMCAHDGWEDCPGREQRQWLGDVAVEHLVGEVAFGPAIHALNAKYLRDAADSQRPDGLTQMFAPGNHGTNELLIPDWTLQWILTAHAHLVWSGDEATLEAIFPAIERALAWFTGLLDATGLVDQAPHWHFMDWAGLGREHQACTFNAQLAGALKAASAIARHIERPRVARQYEALAARICAALNARHWDEARGVYVDMVDGTTGAQYPRVSQHANAAMILWGEAPPERWARMVARITDPARVTFTAIAPVVPTGQPLDEQEGVVLANTFYSHFVQCALLRAGRADRVLAMQRERYGPMLARGATTLWESYEPTSSLCHGFSASPTYQLSTGVLGLHPEGVGCSRLRIRPQDWDLAWVRCTLPTVRGPVQAQARRDGQRLSLALELPPGMAWALDLPAGWRLVEGALHGEAGAHAWAFDIPASGASA